MGSPIFPRAARCCHLPRDARLLSVVRLACCPLRLLLPVWPGRAIHLAAVTVRPAAAMEMGFKTHLRCSARCACRSAAAVSRWHWIWPWLLWIAALSPLKMGFWGSLSCPSLDPDLLSCSPLQARRRGLPAAGLAVASVRRLGETLAGSHGCRPGGDDGAPV
ncbi:hypothetical protein ACLOJK_019383 [Asimina triloba]